MRFHRDSRQVSPVKKTAAKKKTAAGKTATRLSIGLIVFAVFQFISGFFVATFPVRPELALVSSLFVVAVAWPSFGATLNWLGFKRGGTLLLVLGLYALGLEALALQTGFPYGPFIYHDKIGAKVAGIVPWTVPFAWTPLLLGAMTLAARLGRERRTRIAFGTVFLLAIDLVLDPGAVAQGFWTYRFSGHYYGVPLSNFVGWVLSGALGAALFCFLAKPEGDKEPVPGPMAGSVLLILSFWTSVALWMSLWIPAGLGACLMAGFGVVALRKEPQDDNERLLW